MTKYSSKITSKILLLLALSLLLISNAHAQVSGTDVFLQGDFLEVGVAQNGSFGSSGDAPAGYNPREGNLIGFLADSGKDGFAVGTPPYDGDFFLPGSPEETWGISFDGTDFNNSRNDDSGTGGDITGTTSNYQDDGDTVTVEWNGSADIAPGQGDDLEISMVYSIDINDPTGNEDTELTLDVTLTNTRNNALNDVYWMRSVDPDNNQNLGDGFSTLNTIVVQRPTDSHSLVNATQATNNSYIQLSSTDIDSRVTYGGFANRSAEDIWNANGLNNTGSELNDSAISIAVRKTIPANSSVTFQVVYRFLPEIGIVNLKLDPALVMENGTDTGTITASLLAPIDLDTTVNLSYGGNAVLNTDFTLTPGTNATTTSQIVIPAGSLSGSIIVTGIPEFDLDGDKNLTVSIDSLVNAFEGDNSGSIVLLDNDSPPCNGDNLYFSSNLNTGTLYSGNTDGTNNVSHPGSATQNYHIAVDHTNGFVYRTTFGGRSVFRTYYNGAGETPIYTASNFSSNILAIAIDVDNQNLYVAEFGGNNRLYCMPADGSGPVVQVNDTLSTTSAMTIDNENDRIFMYETGTAPDRIRVANFGANCEALTFTTEVQENNMGQSFGLSLIHI